MSFLNSITAQPDDPIFGLSEEFRADSSDKKINLAVGAYQSDDGKVFEEHIVRETAKELSANEPSKGYLPIGGSAAYLKQVRNLLFGSNSNAIAENKIASIHTPGGTGALRIAAEFLFKNTTTVKDFYISDPTWPNHQKIFGNEFGAGFNIKTYPYYNSETHQLLFEEFNAELDSIPAHSPVLIHLCCHNPSGIDLSLEQWDILANSLKANNLIPVIDCAYQGFADIPETDRKPLEILLSKNIPFLAAQSFSKTFTIYGERTGALHVVCRSTEEAVTVDSNLLSLARASYSNPPRHGGGIVEAILSSSEKTELWSKELGQMRERIDSMRQKFCDMLEAKGFKSGFTHIREGKGMFSFSGLNPEQVKILKAEYHIYMPNSGRICLAALNSGNIEYVVNSICSVLAD